MKTVSSKKKSNDNDYSDNFVLPCLVLEPKVKSLGLLFNFSEDWFLRAQFLTFVEMVLKTLASHFIQSAKYNRGNLQIYH